MTNRQIRVLAARFARTFKLRWLPKGDPSLMDGFPPGTVIDAMRGAEVAVLYVTKKGRGTGFVVADAQDGTWKRVRPESVARAVRERKSCYRDGQWVS